MKRLLLLAGCLCAAGAFAQKGAPKASIDATISGLKDSVVYIIIPKGDDAKKDSVKVVDGHFSWKGSVPEPQKIYIMMAQRYNELFMENAHVTIRGNADSLEHLQIKGSKTQAEYDAYQTSVADITKQQHALYDKYESVKNDEAAKAAWEKQLDALSEQKRGRTARYIAAHPNSVVSLNMVAEAASMGEYAKVNTLYQQLSPAMKQTHTGTELAERLEVLRKSAVGQHFMDFTQNDVNGKPVKLSDFKGKYVLLDFWASWCGPCRAENPNVLKNYNQFKDKNFTVVGVSLDESDAKWKEAIAHDNMPWMELSDLKGWKNEVAAQYGIRAIPSNFLIDPNGIIIAKDLRGAALEEKLTAVLQ